MKESEFIVGISFIPVSFPPRDISFAGKFFQTSWKRNPYILQTVLENRKRGKPLNSFYETYITSLQTNSLKSINKKIVDLSHLRIQKQFFSRVIKRKNAKKTP